MSAFNVGDRVRVTASYPGSVYYMPCDTGTVECVYAIDGGDGADVIFDIGNTPSDRCWSVMISNLEHLPNTDYPDGNPKTVLGATKVPLHLVPPAATHYTALAFADGAKKYGPYNWREQGVSASVYVSAAKRHLDAYWDGQDESDDAKVHHLGHVMACCAIMLDAMNVGKLNDDRPPKGPAAALQQEYVSKHSDT